MRRKKMISRTNKRTAKIAYFAVIHGIYFEQFPGLKENLYRYHDELLQKVKANDVEVVDFMVFENNIDFWFESCFKVEIQFFLCVEIVRLTLF